mmetsp:Transcript_17788/g.53586  ORF Transcript_17788/g.53586 Transcript_17788/m.53586 type:complete len:258 (-) Transcript_17788:178-951(-)
MIIIAAPGTKNAQRQAWYSGTLLAIASVRYGMMICVQPPPEFPMPPAKALAVPTTVGLNMMAVQYWQHTKHARLKPMQQRTMTNPAPLSTTAIKNVGADVRLSSMAWPSRGPNMSQKLPITMRAKQVPVMEAMDATEMVVFVRLRSSLMMLMRGAAAKVARKAVANAMALTQNASMWGGATLYSFICLALPSLSTSRRYCAGCGCSACCSSRGALGEPWIDADRLLPPRTEKSSSKELLLSSSMAPVPGLVRGTTAQ